jgi:hypothetical protein
MLEIDLIGKVCRETIRAFSPAIKEIDVLPNGARPAGATESQRRYCAASSLLICASLAGKNLARGTA